MNYEEMSDFEINQMVTCELFGCHEWSVNQEGTFYHCGSDGSSYFIQTVADYCNNPSDAWPIMRDLLIGVSPDEDGVTCIFYGYWTASAFCSQLSYTHKNPLRAAMIVFLMTQEQGK